MSVRFPIRIATVAAVVCLVGVSAPLAAECEFREIGTAWFLEDDCETESTIMIPEGITLDGRGKTITAIETMPGGWTGAVVQTAGSRATVRHVTITTEDLACICARGADRLQGIRFDGASGLIWNTRVTGINKGDCNCDEGVGIVVSNPPFDGSMSEAAHSDVRRAERRATAGTLMAPEFAREARTHAARRNPRSTRTQIGDRTVDRTSYGGFGVEVPTDPLNNAPARMKTGGRPQVEITGNIVDDYQKGGITVNGNVFAKVIGNSVRGAGPIDYIAQNGIQVAYGARGTIGSNVVDGNWFTGDAIATGIYVFETDSVLLNKNGVFASQQGIALEAWCYFAPSADDNVVDFNLVDGAQFAINVAGFVFDPPFTSCDPSASRNQIVNNVIFAGGASETSIVVEDGVFCDGCSFTPIVEDNEVSGNDVNGFPESMVEAAVSLPPLPDVRVSETRSAQPYLPD